MPPIVLKIKGNDSFLPFSNLNEDELSKTWRVCTKVKDSLENGSRLENLSWRLWFIQNVILGNDIKSNSKFKKWSIKTTENIGKASEVATASTLKRDTIMLQNETPESVLNYSLDEIKPAIGTENFILNQFTSDQEGNQMIELKDIFPLSMQEDFMYSNDQVNFSFNNASSWEQQRSPIYTSIYPETTLQETSYTPMISSTPVVNPISGINSLFSTDQTNIPSMTIPADNNIQQQQSFVVDYNNAVYVAAAAATTAAALTTIPNATLHNKLLATLPPQTLASAERLLSPAKRASTNLQQKNLMNSSSQQLNFIPENDSHHKLVKKETELKDKPMLLKQQQRLQQQQQQQHHYYSTFQLDPYSNTLSKTKHNDSNFSSTISNSTNNEKPSICSNCNTTSTPLWRRSTDDKILCNACGLYYKLHNTPRPKHFKSSPGKNKDNCLSRCVTEIDKKIKSETSLAEQTQHHQQKIICSNCGTTKTPLWRRDIEGSPLCNACGLYLKLHNEQRPLSMKTDVIKKRQRTETLIASTVADEQIKKPRYFDQQSLYSKEQGTALGYRNIASSLPGTGILMMTTTVANSNHSSSTRS